MKKIAQTKLKVKRIQVNDYQRITKELEPFIKPKSQKVYQFKGIWNKLEDIKQPSKENTLITQNYA